MHRFLTISLITLALVVGAVGAAPTAQAQGTGAAWSACFDDTDCASDACVNGMCAEAVTAPAADTPGNVTPQGNAPAEQPPITAGQGIPTTPVDQQDSMYNGIMIKIMGLFAWLLGVAAITLDNAVYYTVITMGDYVSHLSAVGVAWRILRDIANIALIFGFLAIGITIILNVDWYGGGTKLLPKLLIAAVLLNFSLFITEAVIDGGNLFATQFYTQINGGMPAKPVNFDLNAVHNEGISNKIMSQLGLATLYGNGTLNTEIFKAGNTWLIGFMGIILFLVTAFVMFSLSFILIARFVILIFLIIFAPIGFIGYAVPQLSKYGKMWSDKLIQQTITAPVLLLLLYIALAIITDVHFLTGFCIPAAGSANINCTPNWTGFVEGNLTGFASMILSFLVAMGLLLAVVIASKSLSAFGAGWATKWGGKLSFGATALGASALLNTASFGARKGLQRIAPNSRFTRGASRVLRYGERARLDVRSMHGVGSGLALGGAGEAAKPIAKSAVGRVRQAGDWLQKTGQESTRQNDQETRIPRLRKAIAANNHVEIGKIVGNMSDKELEDGSVQRLIANNPVAVAALPQSRFDKLLTSDALNDAQKNNLRKQRENGLKARFTETAEYRNPPTHQTAPNAPIPSEWQPGTNMSLGEQAISTLSNEAASQLPDEVLLAEINNQPDNNVYKHLSQKQLGAIFKADKIKDATAITIGTFLSTDPAFLIYFRGRNPQQKQDLNTFWHMHLSTANTTGGGATGGGGAQPPTGFQQNPGGNIFIPTGIGGNPRPQTPITPTPTITP